MTTNADAIVSLARLGEIARRAPNTADAEAAKACCAAAYGVDVVGLFLGDSYHPGGADLTRRLADLLALSPGERVLDVAAGIGTSALLLALERHVDVLGIDLGENQIDRARLRASVAGLARRARFELGDAERLTVDEGSFDAAVCECAFCTFPDKATAAAELARVVRPGGRIGISDVWLHPEHLDPELAGLAGRIACLADARPVDELCALLERGGMHRLPRGAPRPSSPPDDPAGPSPPASSAHRRPTHPAPVQPTPRRRPRRPSRSSRPTRRRRLRPDHRYQTLNSPSSSGSTHRPATDPLAEREPPTVWVPAAADQRPLKAPSGRWMMLTVVTVALGADDVVVGEAFAVANRKVLTGTPLSE